jgi:hypothetical protein
MLFGSLCYGRNYFSKRITKERFPCKLLLAYLNPDVYNKYLPSNIRAALLYVFMCAHLDSKPRKQRIVPNLTHKLDLKKGNDESASDGQSEVDNTHANKNNNSAFDIIKTMLKFGDKHK